MAGSVPELAFDDLVVVQRVTMVPCFINHLVHLIIRFDHLDAEIDANCGVRHKWKEVVAVMAY